MVARCGFARECKRHARPHALVHRLPVFLLDVLQVDGNKQSGKVRARLEVPADVDDATATSLALACDKVVVALDGGEPRKVIARPPKLVNVVV